MYVLIESEINMDEDMYVFRGAFWSQLQAQAAMEALIQENADDDVWDIVERNEMSGLVTDKDLRRSVCVRWMIFDTENEDEKFYF